MAYQICRISPIYHHSTDGIIGSRATTLPNLYETVACAEAIASKLHHENYESCGDDSFEIIVPGESVFDNRRLSLIARFGRASIECDEIPF